MRPFKINKSPIIVSLVLSSIVAIGFYFINQSVASLQQQGEMASSYADMLSFAKWLIIAGITIKGLVSGISFKLME